MKMCADGWDIGEPLVSSIDVAIFQVFRLVLSLKDPMSPTYRLKNPVRSTIK